MDLAVTGRLAGRKKKTVVTDNASTDTIFATQPTIFGSLNGRVRGRASSERRLYNKHTMGMAKVVCCRTMAVPTKALYAIEVSKSAPDD